MVVTLNTDHCQSVAAFPLWVHPVDQHVERTFLSFIAMSCCHVGHVVDHNVWLISHGQNHVYMITYALSSEQAFEANAHTMAAAGC